MLIVVKDRDVHGFLESFFYVEALWSLYVFQIDAAEGRLQQLAGFDDLIRILGIKFYVKHINVGKTLKKNPFPFHNRLTGEGSKIAKTKYGGSIGYNRNQVAFGGVF